MDEASLAQRKLLHSCALLAVLGSTGCGPAPAGRTTPGLAEVVAAHVVKKTIVEWDEYVGRLELVESVEVRARVNGYLQSITFEEGQLVKAGD